MFGRQVGQAIDYLSRLHHFGEEVPINTLIREISISAIAGNERTDDIIEELCERNVIQLTHNNTIAIWRR